MLKQIIGIPMKNNGISLLSINERINRINETSRIIYIEDMTIHEIDSLEIVGELLFVYTPAGFLFQDLDIFTLEEACEAERFINKIKKLLII